MSNNSEKQGKCGCFWRSFNPFSTTLRKSMNRASSEIWIGNDNHKRTRKRTRKKEKKRRVEFKF